MSAVLQDGYGWRTQEAPHSCAYLGPKVLEVLQALKVNRVLDVGAGNGALCADLSAAGLTTVGMEVDADGVAIARQAYPGLRFHCLGVYADPATMLALEPRFDAAVSTEVIEHLYSPHQLPTFVHPLLCSGGYLILTTPYHGYLKNLALSLFNKWDHHHTALWQGGHIKFWSRATLSELLRDNGFDVVGFHGVGRVPYLWKSMVLVARKRPGDLTQRGT